MPLWKGWYAYLDGHKHTVEVEHGRIQNIIVKLNGIEVLNQKQIHTAEIRIGSHALTIKVEYRFFFYKYDLFIDGYSPYSDKPLDSTPYTIPAWKRAIIFTAMFIFGFLFGLIGLAALFVFFPFLCLGFSCCSKSRKKKGPEEPRFTQSPTGAISEKTRLVPAQTV